jgi:hypothetical protein
MRPTWIVPLASLVPLVVLTLPGGCSSGFVELPGAPKDSGTSSSESGSGSSSGSGGDAATESGPGDSGSADAPHDAPTDAIEGGGGEAGEDAASDTGTPDAAGNAPDGGAAGEVWVVRAGAAGAGSAPSNLATAAFIDRFAIADGSSRGTITLPVAASGTSHPLTLTGSAMSEGALERTGDGHYVVLTGYAAAPGAGDLQADGSVGSIKDTPTTGTGAVLRVVGRVDATGAVDTTFTTTAYSSNDIRGAASNDGTAYWLFGDGSGTSDGIAYQATSGGAFTSLSTGVPTNRVAGIFAGRLYGASATGAVRGVFTLTDPLPTVAETAAVLPGFPTATGPSPYGFAALAVGGAAAIDTIYVCDDRGSASGGGVQRWKLVAGTWTLGTTLNDSMTSGCRGVAASFDGTSVTLLVSTTETTGNRLLRLVDTAAGATTVTATVLATAPANTVFRGVSLAPN